MKQEKDDKLFTPGPTQYNVELKPENPQWTINATKRSTNLKKPKTPGCGSYEYKTYIGEGPKFSFGPVNPSSVSDNENKKNKKNEEQGPGFYSIIDTNTGPKYSMYAKNYDYKKELQKKSEVPGVGQYELRKVNSFDIPCFRFDKSERKNLDINEDALKYPGPEKYYINYNANCTSTPKWSFNLDERFPYRKEKNKFCIKVDTPGPGAYKTRIYIGTEGPFYSFSRMKDNHIVLDDDEIKKIKEFPSVGKYIESIQYLPDLPSYTFSNLKSKNELSDKGHIITPGPGNYEPNKEVSSTFPKGPQWSWSLSKVNRDEDVPIKGSKKLHIITPGPGYYEDKIGKIPQGPQITMSPTFPKVKVLDFPGPGEYNVIDKTSGSPEYTISKGKRDEEYKRVAKDNYPGPGAYQIKDTDLAKCFTISKNKRRSKKKDSFPGPGSYRIPTSFDYINNMTRDKGAFDSKFRYI